jgi:hypothetical protein
MAAVSQLQLDELRRARDVLNEILATAEAEAAGIMPETQAMALSLNQYLRGGNTLSQGIRALSKASPANARPSNPLTRDADRRAAMPTSSTNPLLADAIGEIVKWR